MDGKDRDWAMSLQWIFDGHNQIFAHSEWRQLQLGGERAKARRQLESWLDRFARAIGRSVWVVYDGCPSRSRAPHLDSSTPNRFLYVFYSEGHEEADDRICRLVRESRELGRSPIVVSSDRKSLLPRVESESQFMSAAEFRRVHERALERPEKWISDSMEDIEAHFLRGSPFPADRPDDGPDGKEDA